MAAYAYHAMVCNYTDNDVNEFFYSSLSAIGSDLSQEELLPLVLKTGEINLKCMALLDKANTETFGNPEPTKVTLEIEKGPFIVITGHDLYDLKQLLEQTKDKGINIYTHGEMLPAHGYPELKKYPHLRVTLVQLGKISKKNSTTFLLLFFTQQTVLCQSNLAMLTEFLQLKWFLIRKWYTLEMIRTLLLL